MPVAQPGLGLARVQAGENLGTALADGFRTG